MAIRHTQRIVKFAAGRTFQTQYGERINAVIALSSGEEVKFWGSLSDNALLSLKKGQAVKLTDADKGLEVDAAD